MKTRKSFSCARGWSEPGRQSYQARQARFRPATNLPRNTGLKDVHRQKERITRVSPLLVIRCQAARWDHAVNVRVTRDALVKLSLFQQHRAYYLNIRCYHAMAVHL